MCLMHCLMISQTAVSKVIRGSEKSNLISNMCTVALCSFLVLTASSDIGLRETSAPGNDMIVIIVMLVGKSVANQIQRPEGIRLLRKNRTSYAKAFLHSSSVRFGKCKWIEKRKKLQFPNLERQLSSRKSTKSLQQFMRSIL